MPISIMNQMKHHELLRSLERLPSEEIAVVNKSGKKEEVRPRKRVRFVETVQKRPSLHIDDYSDSEIRQSWYSAKEVSVMKKEGIMTLKKIDRIYRMTGTIVLGSDSVTLRGLEAKEKLGHLEKKANKLTGLCAVINEQAQQRQNGIFDDEAIGRAYELATQHCLEKAFKLAKQDAIEARN